MRDAVIVEAVRTPVGRRRGALSGTHAVDVSALVLNELVRRAGVEAHQVDDVVWGCVQQAGMQAHNIARNAVLAAGWPESVPGTTVDRQCGSSQQAVHFAAAAVMSGQADWVAAGGVEIMSAVPIGSAVSRPELGDPFSPRMVARYAEPFHQGIGAEMMAKKWNLSRSRLDEFAALSHERLAEATDSEVLRGEMVDVAVDGSAVLAVDEGLRRTTTVEALAGLQPAFVEDGVIHAGNASQISDGAAALLLTTSELAKAHGVRPIARVHTAVVIGDDPVMMLNAPIPATRLALDRAGLSIEDIGAYEVNEAFAPVPLAWLAETGADPSRLNPYGGAIAMGHPLGASGARLMTTLLHHMRREQITFGLQTMCEGGGTANATILELL